MTFEYKTVNAYQVPLKISLDSLEFHGKLSLVRQLIFNKLAGVGHDTEGNRHI